MVTDERSVLQRLVDKDSIQDLIHEYSYCVDHRRYDDVVELFTSDCVVDYGPLTGSLVRSRSELRRVLGDPRAGFEATSHHNANVLVTFESDDRATVRASVYAWHRQTDGTTPRLWGYYHDSVVRTPDGWRFASRQLRVLGVENWHAHWHWALDDNVG
jgi:3-phenylpropionate/cinnamic acid dioxygenase small subunit